MKSPTMRDTLVPRRAASMRAHSSTLSSTVMVRFFMAAIVHEFRATRNSCRHMIPHWPLGALLPWCYKQSALPLHFPPAAAGVGDTAMTTGHLKTAFVFSGGGSLGAVQVGMLQALSRAQVPVDLLVGASVGALNGAFYADDPSPDGADRLAQLWRGLQRRDIFPLTLLAGLRALLSGSDHLVQPDKLRQIIGAALRMRRVEEARLPLHILTTDVL